LVSLTSTVFVHQTVDTSAHTNYLISLVKEQIACDQAKTDNYDIALNRCQYTSSFFALLTAPQIGVDAVSVLLDQSINPKRRVFYGLFLGRQAKFTTWIFNLNSGRNWPSETAFPYHPWPARGALYTRKAAGQYST
jgi:hypothetical protein